MAWVAGSLPPPAPHHAQGQEQQPGRASAATGTPHRRPTISGCASRVIASIGRAGVDLAAVRERSLLLGGQRREDEWLRLRG